MLTCRSAIASSSADCTLAGARLISSASTRLAKIGPELGVERLGRRPPDPGADDVGRHQVGGELQPGEACRRPRRPGCARRASWPRRARPRAGTWPRASSPTSIRSTIRSWPTTTRLTSNRARSSRAVGQPRRLRASAHRPHRSVLGGTRPHRAVALRRWLEPGVRLDHGRRTPGSRPDRRWPVRRRRTVDPPARTSAPGSAGAMRGTHSAPFGARRLGRRLRVIVGRGGCSVRHRERGSVVTAPVDHGTSRPSGPKTSGKRAKVDESAAAPDSGSAASVEACGC